jgi:hypothetical protein
MKSSTSIICVFALAAAVGLAGCGGSSNLSSIITPGDNTTQTSTDAFFTAVSKLVANTPDDTEADQSAFEAAVATAPDDTEPQPLG